LCAVVFDRRDTGPASPFSTAVNNTPKVAMKHYLQVTEEDYRKASESPTDRQAG